MPGYANPIIHLPFDDLAEDGDKIWVAIRNPQLQPPDTLRPDDVPVDADGKPLNAEDAARSMYTIIAGLVVAWRVYAADVDVTVSDSGEAVVGEQELLPSVSRQQPATPDMIRRLPMAIITAISNQIRKGINPPE